MENRTPAAQTRARGLNVVAEALAELMDSQARNDEALREAANRLRQAVGLEVRH